jgi:uracil-DNA glycosylase
MAADRAASALKWWQDAGVDTIVGETPRDWLAAPVAKPAIVAQERAAAPTAPAAPLPDTLDAFQGWLLDGELSLPAATSGRVGPAGDPASGLMVMIDMPSAEDVAAGALLSGEAGELFDRMMGAIGLDRDRLYLASLSPARTVTGMFDAAAAKRAAELGRHHVGLVRPQALLLFGDACARALLGAPVAQARGKWHELATRAGNISTLVTIRPEKLVSQPGLKKLAWEDLQLLREGRKP